MNEFAASNAPLSTGRRGGREVNNRLDKLFAQKNNNILNVYCTAGYPKLNSTLEVMEALQQSGADIIELGIPYSDPIADGPVIQQSNMQALQNGMHIRLLFEQLKNFRANIQLPVVLMGYLNPVLQFGIEHFCEAAAAVGVDGIILPDLPLVEFETEYRPYFQKYDLRFIFLVTPETGEQRVRHIDNLSSGFLYAVSSSATTGQQIQAIQDLEKKEAYLQKLQQMQLQNPVLVGFGIKDKTGFDAACRYTSGAIIGSAYIKALENADDIGGITKDFINGIKG